MTANKWVEFVKKWAKDHDTTYGCAISQPACKEEYRAKYGNRKKLTKAKEKELMGMEDISSKAAQASQKEKYKEMEERFSMGAEEYLTKKLSKEKAEELRELSRMMGEDYNVPKLVITEKAKAKLTKSKPKKSKGTMTKTARGDKSFDEWTIAIFDKWAKAETFKNPDVWVDDTTLNGITAMDAYNSNERDEIINELIELNPKLKEVKLKNNVSIIRSLRVKLDKYLKGLDVDYSGSY